MKAGSPQERQPFFDQTTIVNAVVDTPKGATFKLKFDEEWNVFRVNKAMPVGLAVPFNFGYLPSTEGGDGDALDIVLLSEHVFPLGSVVLAKVIAVLEAIQIERRHSQRNDRLIGIPLESCPESRCFRLQSSTGRFASRSLISSSNTTNCKGKDFDSYAMPARPKL